MGQSPPCVRKCGESSLCDRDPAITGPGVAELPPRALRSLMLRVSSAEMARKPTKWGCSFQVGLPSPCTQAEVSLERSAERTLTAKAKMVKWDDVDSSDSGAAKETISRTRGNLGREKVLANRISDKG